MPAPDYASEIANLEAALATGELTVEQAGERVTYRDTAQIKAGLAYFREQAAQAATAAANRSRFGFSAAGFSRD